MPNSSATNPRLRLLLEIVLTASVYFVLAKLSLALEFQSSNATPVWPPSGFAFAIVLLLGYRVAPGIMLGAFSANILIFLSNKICDLPTAIWVSSIISIGNTGEALAGYYLLKKLIPDAGVNNFFLKVNNIFFFLLVAFIMCIISCTIGTTAVFLAHIINSHQYSIVWITWWLGDVSGILLVTPFILIWRNSYNNRAYIFTGSLRGKGEVAALLFAVLLASGIVFDNWFFQLTIFKWAFWVIPVLIWAAVRFDQRMTVTAIVLCSSIAIWGTVSGHGPFAIESLNDSLLSMQAYISIICVTTLALNASISERRKTEAMLRDAGNQLEVHVQERTAELLHITNQLREKNIELEKTNEELESFAYVASHDLQEPLRKIRVFADLIRDKEIRTLSENANNYFNKIESAAGRMQQLILDLLTYSGTNTTEKYFENTDLNLLLEQVKKELNEKISETHAVIEVSQLPQLKIIPFQFQQLFTNLISNSIKFSKPGIHPHIYIKSRVTEGIKLKEIKGAIEKKYYQFSISDNGIGFDSQFNEQIFGLFKRLNSRDEYAGTGIGLAICKRIVENHNGIITASGELNKGATFNIYIPIV